jgi:hypothetical protein
MDIPEFRIMGALILLLGVSCFAVGVSTGQLSEIVNLLRTAFKIATV